MTLLKKLLKWALILLLVVGTAGLVAVWGWLGVNPFEGSVDELYQLVSNDVHFYARFPGTAVLDEPLLRKLEQRSAGDALTDLYDRIGVARRDLEEISRNIAEQVNPQLPFGFEIHPEEDFVHREIAVAGWMRDVGRMRFDSLILLTRMAGYGRFVSALKTSYVRSQLPFRDRLEIVKGHYFRFTLDARDADAFNALLARPLPDNAIYFGRIKDVLLVSDNPDWIEAAILGGRETLPADAWFESEFIRKPGRRPEDIEFFVRPSLTQSLLGVYGREDIGGPLAPVRRFLPQSLAGELTASISPTPSGLSVELSNNPPSNGFEQINQPHLINLYRAEKHELRSELSREGIGRLIPRERTVGAVLLRIEADDLADLFVSFLSPTQVELFNEQLRQVAGPSGRRYADVTSLLKELLRDFEDTHLLVLHRPAAFDGQAYPTFNPTFDVPAPQLFYSFVSRVRDNVPLDKVRTKIAQHLPHLQLQATGAHESGRFHTAKPVEAETDEALALVRPSFGGVTDTRYFLFSSNPEAAAAIFEAATDERARLVNDPGVQAAVGRLPDTGTLALVLRGRWFERALWDQVQRRAQFVLNPEAKLIEWRRKYQGQGLSEEQLVERLLEERETYISSEYPDFRERYRAELAALRPIDTIALGANLGVGAAKGARAKGYIVFDVEDGDLSGAGDGEPGEPGAAERDQ